MEPWDDQYVNIYSRLCHEFRGASAQSSLAERLRARLEHETGIMHHVQRVDAFYLVSPITAREDDPDV